MSSLFHILIRCIQSQDTKEGRLEVKKSQLNGLVKGPQNSTILKKLLERSVLRIGCTCISFQIDIRSDCKRKVVRKEDKNLCRGTFNTSFEIKCRLGENIQKWNMENELQDLFQQFLYNSILRYLGDIWSTIV